MPGVDENAVKALGQHRVALAGCKKKHQNVVDNYEQVRRELGEKKG